MLINILAFRVGAYSGWVLIQGGCLFEIGAYSN